MLSKPPGPDDDMDSTDVSELTCAGSAGFSVFVVTISWIFCRHSAALAGLISIATGTTLCPLTRLPGSEDSKSGEMAIPLPAAERPSVLSGSTVLEVLLRKHGLKGTIVVLAEFFGSVTLTNLVENLSTSFARSWRTLSSVTEEVRS
ncbi:hypothetical protein J1614_000408 [Plenodomus biglobosus]|nr:hypothetical protein J1614_000408 [Plenodomus biglobosus]